MEWSVLSKWASPQNKDRYGILEARSHREVPPNIINGGAEAPVSMDGNRVQHSFVTTTQSSLAQNTVQELGGRQHDYIFRDLPCVSDMHLPATAIPSVASSARLMFVERWQDTDVTML
ncbi:hypothetical protein LTR81_023730 [Elasticomyces elasticus]